MNRNRPITPDYLCLEINSGLDRLHLGKPKQARSALGLHYLSGKWQITAFYLHTDQGWELTKKYAPNSFVWEFCPDGVLVENRKGRPLFQTTFALSADTKELVIDRAGFEKGDALCFNGYYEVNPINDNECLIYDLESKSEKPGICKYRMKIKQTEHSPIN